MYSLYDKIDEAAHSRKQHGGRMGVGTIIIEGVKCRYEQEFSPDYKTSYINIYVADIIGTNTAINFREAIKDAIIELRKRKLKKTSVNKNRRLI